MPINSQKKSIPSKLAPENIARILKKSWLWREGDKRWGEIISEISEIIDNKASTYSLSNTERAALISTLADKFLEANKSGSIHYKTQAAELYKQAVDIDPTYTPNLISYACFLLEDDNPEQAQTCLALAYKAKGEAGLTPHMNVMLADIYQALGQNELAQACIGWALEQKDDPYLRQKLTSLEKNTGKKYQPKDYLNVTNHLEYILIILAREPKRYAEDLEKARNERKIETEVKSIVQYSQSQSDQNLRSIFNHMIKKTGRFGGQRDFEAEMGRLYFEMLKQPQTSDDFLSYSGKSQTHLAFAIKGPGVNIPALYQYALLLEYMGETNVAITFYESLQKEKGGTLSPHQTLSLARLYNKVSDPEKALAHAEKAYHLAQNQSDNFTMHGAKDLIESIRDKSSREAQEERDISEICNLLADGKAIVIRPSTPNI